jgi:molecular chaperone DnaK (HSP70)
MLSHTTVEDVGGLKVDESIANYLAEQFMKKHGVDPRKNKKSYIKLLSKASNTKETLSANKDTTVYIEGLIDGIDMSVPINRQVIEEMTHFNEFPKYIE